MLKFIDSNQKNFSKKLESILEIRKLKQLNQSSVVKKILLDVKKQGDKAVIKYEKKYSKIKSKTNKISLRISQYSRQNRQKFKKLTPNKF